MLLIVIMELEAAGEGVRNSSPAEAGGPEDWSGLKPAAETPGHGSNGAVCGRRASGWRRSRAVRSGGAAPSADPGGSNS